MTTDPKSDRRARASKIKERLFASWYQDSTVGPIRVLKEELLLSLVEAGIEEGERQGEVQLKEIVDDTLVRERDALRAEVERLREAIRFIRDGLEEVPPGPDLDADPKNQSPEDGAAHSLGLLCQQIDATLKPKEEPKP